MKMRRGYAGNVNLRSGGGTKAGTPQAYWTLGFSLSVLPLLVRAEQIYRRMPRVPLIDYSARMPSLSVIIPARNEAHNLRRLLPSLREQIYPGALEVVVVDDHSTDGTAEIVMCEMQHVNWTSESACLSGAASDDDEMQEPVGTKSLRLLQAPGLPPDWLGKPHASHQGACAAQGEWLLFTDADTEHHAFSLASAVAFAAEQGLDGLSMFLQQETRGLLDSSVLMVAFAGLFAGLRRSDPVLNGQYVLVRRNVYESCGGFATVRSEMMDDLALGKLLADQGFRAPIMRGEELASVHMYENWSQMWQGVSRLGSGSLRYSGLMALVPVIFITGVMTPLWTLLFNSQQLRDIPRLWLIWLASITGFLPWARRFVYWNRLAAGSKAPVNCTTGNDVNAQSQRWSTKLRMPLMAVLSPAAAIFLQTATLLGFVHRLVGHGVSWKDRKV